MVDLRGFRVTLISSRGVCGGGGEGEARGGRGGRLLVNLGPMLEQTIAKNIINSVLEILKLMPFSLCSFKKYPSSRLQCVDYEKSSLLFDNGLQFVSLPQTTAFLSEFY